MKNGTCWLDMDGNPIQAHGGVILQHSDIYYWYGENKDADTTDHRVPFIGFSCYSSKDLVHWHNEGLVFESVKEDPDSEIGSNQVGERPKVVYNPSTKKFVMWFHLDDSRYKLASIGVAIAESPTGPFVYQGSLRPDDRDSRDMTLYADEDGSVYCISSTDANSSLLISKLDDNYTGLIGEYKIAFPHQYREAPVVLKENGHYYMFTSGCTGWDPNAMLYGLSGSIMGNWMLIDNPCTGPNYRKTFFGQTSNAFQLDGQWYIMLDHWNKSDLRMSGYSFLPVHFRGSEVDIPWTEEFLGK